MRFSKCRVGCRCDGDATHRLGEQEFSSPRYSHNMNRVCERVRHAGNLTALDAPSSNGSALTIPLYPINPACRGPRYAAPVILEKNAPSLSLTAARGQQSRPPSTVLSAGDDADPSSIFARHHGHAHTAIHHCEHYAAFPPRFAAIPQHALAAASPRGGAFHRHRPAASRLASWRPARTYLSCRFRDLLAHRRSRWAGSWNNGRFSGCRNILNA